MQLDYVDIFYHHRMDPDTPLMETMLALLQIVQSGKAIYAGISNYDGETMKKAVEIAKEIRLPLVINQNRYSILDRKVEGNGLKAAAKEGMGLICFSPLAQGLLSNRYVEGIPEDSRMIKDGRYLHKEDFTEEKRQMLAKLLKIAGERGQSLSEMALSWVLRDKSTTSVLVGVSKKEQLWENVKALENTCFTAEEEEAIRVATAL
jgi:aldo/keto reductase family protein